MLEQIADKVVAVMRDLIGPVERKQLYEAIMTTLSNYSIESKIVSNCADESYLIATFISAKQIEGCSSKTLDYYNKTISHAMKTIDRPITQITTDDLRCYLSNYQESRSSSKITIDNIRRILSSFYSWLEDEDYVFKSPIRRIHKVKMGRVVKDTFSDEELESLRDECDNSRDLAMIDILSSTGMRVGELVRLDRKDIDFNERECVVYGKGDSERRVYFDARTKIHLEKYVQERVDENEALFVSLNSPHSRMSICGVESVVKRIGRKISVEKAHPHKFRRTMATRAIDKGMPIEQVQKLLGHVRIDTTMQYAMVNQSNVKISHRKFIS